MLGGIDRIMAVLLISTIIFKYFFWAKLRRFFRAIFAFLSKPLFFIIRIVMSWRRLFPIFVSSKLLLNVIDAITYLLYINLNILAKIIFINLYLVIVIRIICIALPVGHWSQSIHTHSVYTFFNQFCCCGGRFLFRMRW